MSVRRRYGSYLLVVVAVLIVVVAFVALLGRVFGVSIAFALRALLALFGV